MGQNIDAAVNRDVHTIDILGCANTGRLCRCANRLLLLDTVAQKANTRQNLLNRRLDERRLSIEYSSECVAVPVEDIQ